MKPNIFNRVQNAVQAFIVSDREKNSLTNDTTDYLRYGPRHKPMLQNWSQVEMSDKDMYTGYPYAVINKRANRAAALGKKFLFTEASPAMVAAAKKQGKELEHPYLELIRKSKEFSRRKFWHDISTYLDLEGVYYLMAVRATRLNRKGEVEVGKVQKFQMLNPYNIRRIIRESDGTVGGYVETRNGTYREIPKEMIIEIRLLNPFDNEKAYSMTDAAKESQFTLKQAGDYTRHSIRGNINTPGAITTEIQLEDHLFDNFISRIQGHTKGEPIFGNGSGAVHWESMQIDLDKAALDKVTDIHRSTLFSVAGVSDMLMGHQKSGTGREVSKTQKDEFTENAVMPQVEDIIDALNLDYKKWYSDWERNEFEIALDNPLETDREAELKDIEIRDEELTLREKLVNMGYEYELANKYAHGEISLEELGEPTLEPKKTPEQLALEAQAGTPQGEEEQKKADTKAAPAPKQTKPQTKAEEDTKPSTSEGKPKANTKNSVEETSPADFKKAVNQVAARDIPELYEDLEVDTRAVTDDDYRGCIMINTEKIPVLQYVKNAEKDLFENPKWDQGSVPAETVPHATLLYGLLNNGNIWKDKVDLVLKDWEMPTVKIKEVSYFDLGDSKAVIGLLEETSEIIDANQRLSLLPHLNTFSEYHPHITFAYITSEADVDKWVTSLGKKYNGQIVSTKGLNYGDEPKDDDDEDDSSSEKNNIESLEANATPQSLKKSSETRVEATHSHDHHDHEFVPNATMEKALNELDPALKTQAVLQEADLQRAVAGLESEIAQAVIEALRRGDFDEAEEIISEAEEEGFIAQLALIFAAYYTIMFPIYAAQLFAARLKQFGQQGVFAMTDDVKSYIKVTARRAAESHVSTVVGDFAKAATEVTEKVTQDELIKVVRDKANTRDPEYMKLLPENPNQEDIVAAVKKGKFDKHPAYKLARSLARQGLGLSEIERKIRETYQKMSETRAKTIARHEASRVFNMSQYQADIQFLTESNNMSNAYKRLRSRTGDPCAVCNLLIQKTRLNPIPFTQNFADLGEELTATYKRPSGKTAVQKIPVNYEAISAGNVHVNCNCEYELVIKNSDGTTLNDLRYGEGVVYNDFDPTQPRDESGKWTDGGVDDVFIGGDLESIDAFIAEQGLDATSEEKRAFDYYCGPKSAYEKINNGLRQGTTDADEVIESDAKVESTVGNVIESMDNVMEKNQLKKGITVYRQVGLDSDISDQLQEGVTFQDDGFVSTTMDLGHARTFGEEGGKRVFSTIELKAGTNGIFPSNGMTDNFEQEFILPRGTTFRVKKRQEFDDEIILELEVVNG